MSVRGQYIKRPRLLKSAFLRYVCNVSTWVRYEAWNRFRWFFVLKCSLFHSTDQCRELEEKYNCMIFCFTGHTQLFVLNSDREIQESVLPYKLHVITLLHIAVVSGNKEGVDKKVTLKGGILCVSQWKQIQRLRR